MGRLDRRRALITGGANGIGAAIARAFVRERARVVTFDLDAIAGAALAESTGLVALTLDVTDFDAVERAIATHGPFDILINNAGVDQHAFFTETTREDWRKLVAVNLEAVFACTHAVLPAMQAAKFGRLVNIASEAGRLGSRGGAIYAASKGGMIAFTKSIARENARYGVTANVIAPGPVDTPMLQRAVAALGAKFLSAMEDATLLRRLGTPEDVAEAAVFLASDAASYITGETLGVSGGMGIGAS
jgi:2-hydroxycyclohexanecarboxyl-CoA dehydrogenase